MTVATIAVRAVICMVGAIGFLINLFSFFLLLKVKLGSRVSNFLVRSQLLIDAFAGMVILLSKLIGDIKTNIQWFDAFLCFAWYSDHGFWMTVILSVHSMVCISVDRIINLSVPKFYRTHQNLLIVMSIFYCLAMVVGVFTPTLYIRKYKNNKCILNVLQNQKHPVTDGLPYVWLALLYILPAMMSIASNSTIIYTIYNTGKPAFIWMKRGHSGRSADYAETPDVLSQAANESNTQADKELVRQLLRKMALTSSIMTILFLLFYAYDTFSFAFIHLDNYLSGYNGAMQQLGVLSISLNCLLNPCVFIYTITPLQQKCYEVVVNVLVQLRCKQPTD